MGMAYRAPTAAYERRLRISRRALVAFRELLGREWISRPDGDVNNALDQLINETPPYLTVTDCNHPDVLTHVHALDVGDETRYAIVRDSCCVTLLSAAMVQRNMRGNWTSASDASDASQPSAVESERVMHVVPAASTITSPFPIVIEHQGALADIVKVSGDGIELRLDERNRVSWQLSMSRAAELRDALDAILPRPPVVADVATSSPTLDHALIAEALAVIDARRAVVMARQAMHDAQLGLDGALEVVRVSVEAARAADERIDALICRPVGSAPVVVKHRAREGE